MNRQEALLEARKRWGKEAAVQEDKRESSPALREAAKVEAVKTGAAKAKAAAELAAASKKYGTDHPKHKAALAKKIAASKEHDRVQWGTYHYRYDVGTVWNMGGFGAFSVRGQGDTWEEAFAKADADKKVMP
jgi:hypothetical protein